MSSSKYNLPQTLPTTEEYLASTLDAVDVVIFSIDLRAGAVVNCNQKLCTYLKLTKEEILGRHYRDVCHKELSEQLERLMQKADHVHSSTGVYYIAKDNIWGQISVRKVFSTDLSAVAVVSITNITDIARSEYEYRHMAFFDQQLDIPNGLQLEQDVAALQNYSRVALIHIDIDHFGTINDVYGWDTGDYLLVQIRDWAQNMSVPFCTLYRVGDDEFAMLIQGITLAATKHLARRMLHRFLQPWKADPESQLELYCTASLVLVHGQYVASDVRSQLFRTASAQARASGFILYDAAMDRRYRRKLRMRQALVNSVQQGMKDFSLQYQPIADPATGNWVGAEALCRWKSDEFGHVPSTEFVGDMEQLGLVDQLDAWVLETAVRQCTEWGLATKNFILDVNLSPTQPLNNRYVTNLLQLLKTYDFPCSKLSLEITESHKFDFSAPNLAALTQLKHEGIQIALDDFGTGYNSFENLMRLPATVLKTDKSFLAGLADDSYRQYLLRMLIDLAHTAGMQVVCEGVETEEQRQYLLSYGADFLQGYLFSKPISPGQMNKMRKNFN